jgi:hypothetical protein
MKLRIWAVTVALLLVPCALDSKDDVIEPFDFKNATTVPVRQCIDGCLRDDEGRAVVHLHFIITCGLCGTTVDVLIYRGIDDRGVEWTFASMFPNRDLTNRERRRRGLGVITEFELLDCIRNHRSSVFPDISERDGSYVR